MSQKVFNCLRFTVSKQPQKVHLLLTVSKQPQKVHLLLSSVAVSIFWILAVNEASLAQVDPNQQVANEFLLGNTNLLPVPQSSVPDWAIQICYQYRNHPYLRVNQYQGCRLYLHHQQQMG